MALTYNTNLDVIATRYLDVLQAKVLKSSFKTKLAENPYYPSLYSLQDTLKKFNIDTEAYEIPSENFTKLTPPFIAFLANQAEGIDFGLVTGMTENTVTYIADGSKESTIGLERFLGYFKGYVLFAEATEESGGANYIADLKKVQNKNTQTAIRIAGIVATLICVVAANFFQQPSMLILPFAAVGVLKLLGVTLTSLLLAYEIDKENVFVKSICGAGKKTNCNAVLDSKAAKIFGMGWSEIGFIYFTSSLIFLLIPTIDFNVTFALIAIANAIAVPYVLFSIYYQWKVVKEWCPLCLGVQGMLITELIWGIAVYWQSPALPIIEIPSVFGAVFSFILPVILWSVLKPLLKESKNFKEYKSAYKRLQNNPKVFSTLLEQQAEAPEGYDAIGINIGNPEAQNTIVKVCSPYCGPCAKAHPEIEELVNTNPNVKVKILFSATNDSNDRGGIVARHLLAISHKSDRKQMQKALDDWYLPKEKDYEAFAAKYPLNGEVEKQSAHIDSMSEWCERAAITHTPTFFVNGYRLPDKYTLEELKDIL